MKITFGFPLDPGWIQLAGCGLNTTDLRRAGFDEGLTWDFAVVWGRRGAPRKRLGVESAPCESANGATLCDLGVFVGQAAEPIPAQDAHARHFPGRVHASAGGSCCSVRRGRWTLW